MTLRLSRREYYSVFIPDGDPLLRRFLELETDPTANKGELRDIFIDLEVYAADLPGGLQSEMSPDNHRLYAIETGDASLDPIWERDDSFDKYHRLERG